MISTISIEASMEVRDRDFRTGYVCYEVQLIGRTTVEGKLELRRDERGKWIGRYNVWRNIKARQLVEKAITLMEEAIKETAETDAERHDLGMIEGIVDAEQGRAYDIYDEDGHYLGCGVDGCEVERMANSLTKEHGTVYFCRSDGGDNRVWEKVYDP